ncbi:hypothetical protein G6O67_002537 [Ophiocordyceps sinensis]|uniref:Uncharacterized protein n=1 Tax=Ophiocordyceps sinensis TaxID=72228 RepID=A0A8H4V7B9_9HYPO|nr:hypothetical protein G6O67_002537 [Ophiocordyceps sinensis]
MASSSSSSSSTRATTSKLHLALLALAASLVSATPFPKASSRHGLAPRADCNGGHPCGAADQLCCGAGQSCATLPGNVATCVAGTYGLYTTTWTETRTYTSTIMTHWMPAPEPTAGVDCVPPSAEQQACGPICCAGWQTCAFHGQCSIKPGYAEPSTVVVTSDGKVTTRYSAPFRVTGTVTITSSGLGTDSPARATRTGDATQAIGADAGTAGGGLSAGAIAGIVIGTLAAVALLLLLCFCCIARGLWAAIFGRGKGKGREREERVHVTERSYSRRASRAPSGPPPKDRHAGWFGGSRPRPASDRREKKKSSGGVWLAIAAGATTLLTLLNLKKDKRAPPRKAVTSRYTDSYYTYSDVTTSPSSSSSGRRTAYTRRTADSRGPRSQYSRTSKRP